jgi:tRNA-modifying protein YgfZ
MESQKQDLQSTQPVYIEQSLRGVIHLYGKDRVDFLQRQTTNDAQQISSERMLTTVLTSPTGRILDVLQITEENYKGEAHIFAITLPGRAPAVSAYFKSRVFFIDQVEIRDESQTYLHFDLAGEGGQEVLRQLGLPTPPQGDQLVRGQFQGRQLRAFHHNHLLGIGFQLVALLEQREQIYLALEKFGVRPLTSKEYEVKRVEAGIPAVDRELTEEHTPLEVNLEEAISVNKGCYTGQEVIARQMNYDKVTRKLVGLLLERDIAAGSTLQAEGKTAGKVTSFVRSPRFGPIALAMVKRPYNQQGVELTVKDGDSETIARVKSLPFYS